MKHWTDDNKRQGRDGDVFLADTSSPITEPGALPEHERRTLPSGGGIVLAVALVLACCCIAVLVVR